MRHHILLAKIVTLKGVFLDEEAHLITLPAADGEIGIMAEHVPSIFKLADTGTVKLHDEQGRARSEITIHGGVARVYDNAVSIVTNGARA